jgi:hypothetical protein
MVLAWTQFDDKTARRNELVRQRTPESRPKRAVLSDVAERTPWTICERGLEEIRMPRRCPVTAASSSFEVTR